MRFVKDLLLHVVDISSWIWRSYCIGRSDVNGYQSKWQAGNYGFNKIDAIFHLTIDEDDLMTEKTPRHNT
jgi:GTP-binding protein HflX